MNQPHVLHRLAIATLTALVWLAAANPVGAQHNASNDWNRPVKPFRIIGNIFYVGASEVSSFLITTPQGSILMDSGLSQTVPLIRDSMKRLSFKLEDVKWLICSHAHYDHVGGLAELKKLT